ncbi:single-stranded DNA-binding protein [bacterium]|jgi:hypothetical protein|nr:single-stranded DNA-binding protein [bacterium]
MSFANLKRNRADIASLTKAAESVGGSPKQSYVDDRYWKPTVDKAGNGYAVIRFLPAAEGEELPWVRYWDHGFKGPTGQWYIENSLTTIGKEDPVSEMNSVLWNSGRDEDKEIARSRKRRLHYVSNIMVVSDPANPSNDGKTFLYIYGKKIFDKIMDVMQPQFQDETPVNPYDFWEGADFKLKIQQVAGYRNYDKSEFAGQRALSDDDTKLESIYNTLYSLNEIVDPKNYKTYEELKAKLNRVLGEEGAVMTTAESVSLDETASAPTYREAAEPVPQQPSFTPQVADNTDDDDSLSYFNKLANG